MTMIVYNTCTHLTRHILVSTNSPVSRTCTCTHTHTHTRTMSYMRNNGCVHIILILTSAWFDKSCWNNVCIIVWKSLCDGQQLELILSLTDVLIAVSGNLSRTGSYGNNWSSEYMIIISINQREKDYKLIKVTFSPSVQSWVPPLVFDDQGAPNIN